MQFNRIVSSRSLGAAMVLSVALVVGFMAGQVSQPRAVEAACTSPHALCSGGSDLTRTAGVHVLHEDTSQGIVYVEPDTGESWNITAYWNEENSPCFEHTETATATVDWLGYPTWWSITSSSTTSNIVDISLCDTGDYCTSGMGHGWGYTMIVDVNTPATVSSKTYHLTKVVFSTTSVDDGYTVDRCSLDTAVSPTTQTFNATDNGTFECSYNCSATLPNIVLTYE